MQHVAACCNMLEYLCIILQHRILSVYTQEIHTHTLESMRIRVLQRVAVLQCVAQEIHTHTLRVCVSECFSVLQRVAVLQCVAQEMHMHTHETHTCQCQIGEGGGVGRGV